MPLNVKSIFHVPLFAFARLSRARSTISSITRYSPTLLCTFGSSVSREPKALTARAPAFRRGRALHDDAQQPVQRFSHNCGPLYVVE